MPRYMILYEDGVGFFLTDLKDADTDEVALKAAKPLIKRYEQGGYRITGVFKKIGPETT